MDEPTKERIEQIRTICKGLSPKMRNYHVDTLLSALDAANARIKHLETVCVERASELVLQEGRLFEAQERIEELEEHIRAEQSTAPVVGQGWVDACNAADAGDGVVFEFGGKRYGYGQTNMRGAECDVCDLLNKTGCITAPCGVGTIMKEIKDA